MVFTGLPVGVTAIAIGAAAMGESRRHRNNKRKGNKSDLHFSSSVGQFPNVSYDGESYCQPLWRLEFHMNGAIIEQANKDMPMKAVKAPSFNAREMEALTGAVAIVARTRSAGGGWQEITFHPEGDEEIIDCYARVQEALRQVPGGAKFALYAEDARGHRANVPSLVIYDNVRNALPKNHAVLRCPYCGKTRHEAFGA